MFKAKILRYGLRSLVIPVWSIFLLLFWFLIRLRILPWLAVLPEGVARVAILLASHSGLIVFICVGIGASSLLLWRWLSVTQAMSIAVLVPMLLVVGSLVFGRIDTQGTEPYAFEPAQRGNVQGTREQLVIRMAQYELSTELRSLIQVRTNVNVRDPKGHSALYWAREPEIVKLLLQAGAKPDAGALVEAAFWGRTDTMKLLFEATPDDGKALVAEVGDEALHDATSVCASGEQDRDQIVQMLVARGAKPKANSKK